MNRKIGVAPTGELVYDDEKTAGTMAEEYDRIKDKVIDEINAHHSPADLDDDPINPAHYTSMEAGLNIDAITCMRAAFGDNDVKAFCLGNALKYIFRSSSKGQNTDINKAIWYLNKFLELGGYN